MVHPALSRKRAILYQKVGVENLLGRKFPLAATH
jgi:hypothetical protein